MKYETDIWPLVTAKHFGAARTVTSLIVIHTAETPESSKAAENVAKYFQRPEYPSSAHVCVDNDSVVQCVPDSRVAYAAPGANHNGVHVELCCYMGQSKTQWVDNYSVGLLAMGASVTAQYCLKYGIPAVHLTDGDLKSARSGIVGHDQVTRVFQRSDHTDPGPNFPWALFMAQVRELVTLRA